MSKKKSCGLFLRYWMFQITSGLEEELPITNLNSSRFWGYLVHVSIKARDSDVGYLKRFSVFYTVHDTNVLEKAWYKA